MRRAVGEGERPARSEARPQGELPGRPQTSSRCGTSGGSVMKRISVLESACWRPESPLVRFTTRTGRSPPSPSERPSTWFYVRGSTCVMLPYIRPWRIVYSSIPETERLVMRSFHPALRIRTIFRSRSSRGGNRGRCRRSERGGRQAHRQSLLPRSRLERRPHSHPDASGVLDDAESLFGT